MNEWMKIQAVRPIHYGGGGNGGRQPYVLITGYWKKKNFFSIQ